MCRRTLQALQEYPFGVVYVFVSTQDACNVLRHIFCIHFLLQSIVIFMCSHCNVWNFIVLHLLPEELHVSGEVAPEVPVVGVPVGAGHLAVQAGEHPDGAEAGPLLVWTVR